MRRTQKQEIIDCVKSLYQAHEEIQGALRCKNVPLARKLLSECQEFAISIGTTIEKLEGEGHPTVALLEKYCDLLFSVFEAVGQGEPEENQDGRAKPKKNREYGSQFNERKIGKLFTRQLIKIDNSVKNDIVAKKEVIFLPYNASMWDSLESVWRKACEDPCCDAYVIPIPYFEKNPDGSLGKMHYEGDQYPDDVPVLNWQSYSIPKRRPDEIYIHNPYDESNYVTSVHPDYYARKLRNYTDMLVYISYFIGINDRVEEHFCITPGVFYADRVIVESENVKKIYVDTLQKFQRENHCEGSLGDLDKKIVVQKSPKLERMERIAREQDKGKSGSGVDIPEEWRDKIYSPEGTRKKIIFYNTTIGALLRDSSLYLYKLKDVLGIFQREKKVALLWRPHPLLETTLKAMRPGLWRKYRDIVAWYKKENWGIYDETADVERAIAISDAYYGDWSSVVEMYKVTGKPIMIQNLHIIEEKEPYAIYGAGVVAFQTYLAVKELFGTRPEAFFVTEVQPGQTAPEGIPIQSFAPIKDSRENLPILVATPETYHGQIVDHLKKGGAKECYCIDSEAEYRLMSQYFRKTGTLRLLEDLPKADSQTSPSGQFSVFMAKSHKDAPLKRSYALPPWIIPVQAGSALAAPLGIQKDSQGDNISKKNANYCELTVTYWAWKNDNSRYKGIFHYRRILNLSERDLQAAIDNDIDMILPLPYLCWPNAAAQYCRYISKEDQACLRQALEELSPEYLKTWELLDRQPLLYTYNMLIAKREIFDSYCEWMFGVLQRAEKYCEPEGAGRADRYAGYLGELLSALYIMKNQEKLKIVHGKKMWMV